MPSDFISRFTQGSDRARATTLEGLRGVAMGSHSLDATETACQVYAVRTFYARRAERQHDVLGLEAWTTGTAGVIGLLSEGAGSATQEIWGSVALVPVLMSRFNANEPIRDLYHGAGQGVDWLASRYLGLRADTDLLFILAEWTPASGATPGRFADTAALGRASGLASACDTLQAYLALPAARQTGWAAGAAGEQQRVRAGTILERCNEALVARAEMETFLRSAGHWHSRYHRMMALDLLMFDAAITQREHEVTYSPLETFAALAASPFEAAASLISGQDGRAAVERLRVQAAFDALQTTLQPIEFPTLPRNLQPVDPIPGGGPTAASAAWREYEVFRARYTEAQVVMRRMALVARADRLAFRYDANANVVDATLATPPPAANEIPLVLPPAA